MPAKAKSKKKEPSWDQIGEMIGKKMEKTFKKEKCGPPWQKHWMFYQHREGGGFGRLIFIIGVLFAMDSLGMLANVPVWTLVLIALGFAMMRL